MLGGIARLEQALAGRYEIQRELGRGGMATVYVARDLRHRRLVAIKVLRPELAIGIAAERFRAEIEIAAALAHPNILPVFDSGGSGDCLYYVMPLVEGESLRARLERETRLPLADALRITHDVADALAYAHGRNIVHRDIKPENILFVEGHAVVTDFGIARAIAHAESRRLTITGMAVGTPLYMSPEQASGDPSVDLRSDIYSLACVLYEMVGGVTPHPGDTPQAVLASKLTDTPKPLDSTGADVPHGLDDVIMKALSTEAEQRYASATAFADALDAATDSRRIALPSHGRRRRFRVSRGATLVFGAVAALGVAGAIATWRVAPVPVVGDDGRIGIAVLPFRATVSEAAQWGEAIPDLLATTLDGTPGMRVADPWSLWRPLRVSAGGAVRSPDPEEGEAIAKRAKACCYLLGSVAQLSGQVEVSVRIYRRGNAEPWHTFAMSAPPDSVAPLVRQIAIEVIRRLSPGPSTLPAEAHQGLTRSPEALKAWLAARAYHRRGQLDSADAALTRSITLDSNFVLALIDATTIRSWLQFAQGQTYGNMRQLAQRAVALSDSLPERPRLRARAMLASIETEGAEAARALDRIVAIDSLDFDAWSMLSYVHTVYGWQYGRTERDAVDAAERAVRLDSSNVPALVRRLHLAMSMNELPDVELQARRLRRADTSSAVVRGMLAAIEALNASDAAFPALLPRLAAAPVPEWITVLRALRSFRPERAHLLIERTRRDGSAAVRRVANGAEVQVGAAEGRWQRLDSLRRAGVFRDAPGFERNIDREMVAGAIGDAGDDELARRSAAALADINPDSARAQLQTRPVWLDGWLVGAYHAMYGDTVFARRWANALAGLPEGGSPRRYGAALGADLEARLAARRGDRPTALRRSTDALALWTVHTENQYEFTPEPAMRFHLASLLRAAGQADSAVTLFRSLVQPTTWMGFYTARAALELGELEEARGNHRDAQRHLLTAARMWEGGDSSIARFRERARRAGAGR